MKVDANLYPGEKRAANLIRVISFVAALTLLLAGCDFLSASSRISDLESRYSNAQLEGSNSPPHFVFRYRSKEKTELERGKEADDIARTLWKGAVEPLEYVDIISQGNKTIHYDAVQMRRSFGSPTTATAMQVLLAVSVTLFFLPIIGVVVYRRAVGRTRRREPPTAYKPSFDLAEASRSSWVRELLRAYDTVLRSAQHAPPMVEVRFARGAKGKIWFVLRPKPYFLRYFMVERMLQVTTAIKAHALATNASRRLDGPRDSDHRDDIEAIEDFQKSLPTIQYKRIALFLLLVLIVLLPQLLGQTIAQVAEQALIISNSVEGIFQLDQPTLLAALTKGSWRAHIYAIALLVASACLVLWIPVSSYKLKRVFFSSFRGEELQPPLYSPVDFGRPAEGVYEVENRCCEEYGISTPREVAFDLLLRGLGLSLLPIVFLGGLRSSSGAPEDAPGAQIAFVAMTLIIAIIGIRVLAAAWESRWRQVTWITKFSVAAADALTIIFLATMFAKSVAQTITLILALPAWLLVARVTELYPSPSWRAGLTTWALGYCVPFSVGLYLGSVRQSPLILTIIVVSLVGGQFFLLAHFKPASYYQPEKPPVSPDLIAESELRT